MKRKNKPQCTHCWVGFVSILLFMACQSPQMVTKERREGPFKRPKVVDFRTDPLGEVFRSICCDVYVPLSFTRTAHAQAYDDALNITYDFWTARVQSYKDTTVHISRLGLEEHALVVRKNLYRARIPQESIYQELTNLAIH